MVGFSAEKSGTADLTQAKRNLTTTIKSQKRFIQEYFPSVKDEDFMLFLTSDDKSNFRFKLATIQKYKGNRKASGKPILYDEIRDILQIEWGAVMVHDQEADDEMAIRSSSNPENHIIVSKDKDLRMVPGWHWEMDVSKPPYYTEDIGFLLLYKQKAGKSKVFGTGIKWFYFQCLVGDRVDNIPGLPKVGDKKAYDALKNCNTARSLQSKVLALYKQNGYTQERLREVKRLLWMKRKR